MTHRAELRDRLRKAHVEIRSLRKLGTAIGLSHTTISEFLSDPDKADDTTVARIEQWLEEWETGSIIIESRTGRLQPSDAEKAAAFDVIAGLVALTLGVSAGGENAATFDRAALAERTALARSALQRLLDRAG